MGLRKQEQESSYSKVSSLDDILVVEYRESGEMAKSFTVICDESNNSPEDAKNGVVNVDIILRGLGCTHSRMNECHPGCRHFYCSDCGVTWDEGAGS